MVYESRLQIKLLPDIAQNSEIHLQDWGIRCDLANDPASSIQKRREIGLGEQSILG